MSQIVQSRSSISRCPQQSKLATQPVSFRLENPMHQILNWQQYPRVHWRPSSLHRYLLRVECQSPCSRNCCPHLWNHLMLTSFVCTTHIQTNFHPLTFTPGTDIITSEHPQLTDTTDILYAFNTNPVFTTEQPSSKFSEFLHHIETTTPAPTDNKDKISKQ